MDVLAEFGGEGLVGFAACALLRALLPPCCYLYLLPCTASTLPLVTSSLLCRAAVSLSTRWNPWLTIMAAQA